MKILSLVENNAFGDLTIKRRELTRSLNSIEREIRNLGYEISGTLEEFGRQYRLTHEIFPHPDSVKYTPSKTYKIARYKVFKDYFFDKLPEDAREQLDYMQQMHEELVTQRRKLKRKIEQVKASQSQLKSQVPPIRSKEDWGTPPETLQLAPRVKIANPYYLGYNASRFVGSPSDYSFSPVSEQTFVILRTILQRNGMDFDVMYASRFGKKSLINYMVTANDNRFVWRKYQTNQQNGMNWVYINGEKIQTSRFLSLDSNRQDQLIQSTK